MKFQMIGMVGALALVIATVAQAESASVATLTQVTGKVMVNKGKGYVAAKSGMSLGDNDRLITLDGSSAAVIYSDGCTSNVKANSVLAVSKALGCKAEVLSVQGNNITPAVRYAAVGDIPPPPPPLVVTPLLTGPVIVGSIIAGSIILGNAATDDNNISGQ